MKKRNIYIIAGVLLVVAVYFLFFNSTIEEKSVKVNVRKGKFDIPVITTGELQAKNSEDITGPLGLRKIRIWNVKITDLIPEGTVVDSGDYIATLDRTEAMSKLKDVEAELENIEQQYIKTQLDTTLELRELRDRIVNLHYAMEESKLTLDQSKFESPATIRQAEINLSKSERDYNQALENYKLKVKQAVAKMQEIIIQVDKEKRNHQEILDILGLMTIKAPKSGMLNYAKEWNGQKKKVGAMISTWEPVVATLPDLSEMISVTYINEIDISKIQKGQEVKIGVDAFPDRKYSGIVTEVANMGELLTGSEAKVFKVVIRVNETDSVLRPGMTTSNSILTASFENVLSVPIEGVYSNDSLSYVFLDKSFKTVKQIVETGFSNENEIIIQKGLNDGDLILLSKPENADKLSFSNL